jgi:hypothetical protein
MKFCFELYLKSNTANKDQWQQFFTSLTAHIGYMNQSQIIMTIKDSVVRFFVSADKDLGILSNNIDIGVLKPVKPSECEPPKTKGTERLITFVNDGNLLDVREKYKVKRGKQLEYIVLNCRRINTDKTYTKIGLYFKKIDGNYSINKKTLLKFPAHLLTINFDENSRYLRKEFPKYINIEKALPILSPENNNALLEVSTFPYFANDYYLNLLDYEFDKHSFIIGASGSGKSKFIELLIDRISRTSYKNNYRVLVIDPHASLRNNLNTVDNSEIIDFSGHNAPELFGDSAKTDISASTELTTVLMKSLLADQFNPKVERVLRFSLYVLFVAQTMSLGFLKRFLTELELRNEIMSHISGNVPPNIEQFFATDYNEIRTTHYTEAILPIISLVDEMQLQPGLVGESEISLSRTIQNNFLTVFSLNKVSMGEKVVKTAAGILMQQIFLLAQARAFNEKIILIIDEVSIVQNPALASILAEARKYNLFVILTQQYFGQVDKSLKDSIFANVYNYYIFRVSEEDAEGLIGNLNIDIPKEIIEEEHKKGIKEETIKKQFMTELHPRECLVRVSANGQIIPVFKARTLDIGTDQSQDSRDKIVLHEAKPIEAPKVTKFIEGTNSVVDKALVFNASQAISLKPATEQVAPSTEKLKKELNDNWEGNWDKGPHRSLKLGTPADLENKQEFVKNYEFNTPKQKISKEEKLKKVANAAFMITKGEIILESAEAKPLPDEYTSSTSTTVKSDPESGYGAGNLASILASQSSSRELVNKRKVKK